MNSFSSCSSTPSVPLFFLGPFPPPVHGFSAITSAMCTKISETHPVLIFNSSPTFGWFEPFKLILRFIGSMLKVKPSHLYVAISGGPRQLLDMVFIIIARLMRVEVVVHHHSFAYLNRTPLYTRVIFSLLEKSIHIVLCDRMGAMLCDLYAISPNNIRVISNSVFLKDTEQSDLTVSGELTLGFLSNITEAKGCFDFIDLLKAAKRHGLSVRGLMAGPVELEIVSAFDEAILNSGCITHLGAVYGKDKESFFSKIDVLVFPTRYVNEAEPVTIWESMQASVPVISFSRGCIDGIVTAESGWVVSNCDNFIEEGLRILDSMSENPELLHTMKVGARARFESSRIAHTINLISLVSEISGDGT